jgi:hypothetical protein
MRASASPSAFAFAHVLAFFAAVVSAGCATRPREQPPAVASSPTRAPAVASVASVEAAPLVDATQAWADLRRLLPGTWETTTESGRRLEIGYRVVSRGSAVLETFGAEPEKQTISLYHPDGRSLMMTHYCGQGNQARLRVSSVSGGRVVFRALDATNVTPEQAVLHELVFALTGDTLVRTEVYRAHDGSTETDVMRFTRRGAAPPPSAGGVSE